MIEACNLFKRYGATMAVNDLSFSIRPGLVTGFLGPNGAGKTTAMRMILGLDAPTQGSVTVDGRRAFDHLLCLAQSNGLDPDGIHWVRTLMRALAAARGIVLFELIPVKASLEEAFMELTRDSVEYQAAGATR